MRANACNKMVSIRQKSVTRNSIGEESVVWTEKAAAWASIEPLRGNEYLSLRADESELTTRIRMPFIAGVTPSMRVVHGTDVYEIREVFSPKEAGRELEILATREAG